MKQFLRALTLVCIANVATAQTPNWSNDVAKIVYAHCTPCHHPGGLGPTSFMTYQDVFDNRFSIEYAVTNNIMPPWPADKNYKQYAHENVLSNAEITTIQQWVAAGGASGYFQNAPAPPVYNNTTQLGTADLSLQIPTYTVTSNSDVYHNFVLTTGLTQTKYATAIEVIPGNNQIVHHVLVFMDTTNAPINSGSAGGTGSNASKLIYGFVPGAQPYFAPPGTGFRIPPSARIIMQLHYAPGSSGQSDDTKINFKFTTTPQREITVNPLLNHFTSLSNGPLSIPANTTKTFYEQLNIPGNWTALYAWPHMHMVGQNIISFANTTTPNDTIRFVNVPNWDFHWQMNYVFPNTVKIPNGSTLRARAFYDNTTANLNNPNSPPQNVTSGEGTGDEMMMVFFAYMPYQTGDENLIVDKRILPKSGTTLCSGQSVLLETIKGTGYTYQWYRNSNLIPGATSYAYTATQAGNYTVSITLGPNNAVSDPVTVTVNSLPTASITPSGTAVVCPGNTVTLSANTGQGLTYRWFRNDTLITGATSATYAAGNVGSYRVEVNNGCYATSQPVVVSSGSAAASIAAGGATSFCAGGSVTLTASAGASYAWSNNATTQSITVSQPGAYTVTVSQPGCSATASQTVSLLPSPTPSFSFSNSSNTVTFNNTSSDATSYSWNFGDGNSSTAANPTHTYAAPGTYTVTLTATNGCGSTQYSTTVNLACTAVSVSVAAQGNTTFCEGETVVLSTTATNGYTYQWLNNNQAIPLANSNTYTASTSGNYTLQVYDNNSCPGVSQAVTVQVNSAPAAPVINNNGGVLESTPASTYEWLLNGNATGVNAATYPVTQSGCYSVRITDANGCAAVSDTMCLLISGDGFVDAENVTLFPNPARTVVFVNTHGQLSDGHIVCHDITGKEILTAPINNSGNSIDVTALGSGMYFMSVHDTAGRVLLVKKLLITRE